MKKPFKCPLVILASIVCVSAPLNAATLLQYQFTGGTLAASSVDAEFTGSDIGRVGFVSPDPFTTDWIYARGDQTSNSPNYSKYFSLTLTPEMGVVYRLTSLDFGTAFYAIGGASNTAYTTNYAVRSSVDGYAANLALIVQPGQTAVTPTFSPQSVDLSGTSFQNLSTAITFRIYIWDNISGSTRVSSIDNLTVVGVTVPEPTSAILLLGGIGFLLSIRRIRAAGV